MFYQKKFDDLIKIIQEELKKGVPLEKIKQNFLQAGHDERLWNFVIKKIQILQKTKKEKTSHMILGSFFFSVPAVFIALFLICLPKFWELYPKEVCIKSVHKFACVETQTQLVRKAPSFILSLLLFLLLFWLNYLPRFESALSTSRYYKGQYRKSSPFQAKIVIFIFRLFFLTVLYIILLDAIFFALDRNFLEFFASRN